MKRTAFHVTFLTTLVLMTAFLTAPFFASPDPLLAASAPKASSVDRTEARILQLHSTLKITPAQEEVWKALTQVMRENAKTLDELSKARADKTKPMNAVEDLKSYSQILDAHAEGAKKFVTAFEELYASMSDEQKKNADSIFRTERHGKSKKE